MPRVTWNTEADWLAMYDYGLGLSYSRDGITRFSGGTPNGKYIHRWEQIVQHFSPGATDRILIPGCGFGWLIEAAQDDGYTSIWGIDYSSHIADNRATETRGDILFVEDDITGGGRVRAQLRQMTGDDEFRWIISESVLESYDNDTEMQGLLNAAETILETGQPTANIIHLVHAVPHGTHPSANLDPAFLVQDIDAWAAIRPTHTWVNVIYDDAWEIRLGTG